MATLKISSLQGLEKFGTALLNDGLPDMLRWFRSKKKAALLMDEVHKHIFDLGPPTPPGKPTGRRRYHQWLMHHVSEIRTSIDTMKDIEFYAGRFPYRKTKIAKHRHLQFHVEAYLNELYILRERLTQFLKFIERQHRRDPRLPQIEAACKVLKDFVIEAMKKGIAIRSSHVHQWRLSDTQLDRLNGISLYTEMPNRKIRKAFMAFYESEYRQIRRRWCEWMADGTARAQELVDSYFDEVFKLIFTPRGRLVYPSRLKF
jgi:hypothetical protein